MTIVKGFIGRVRPSDLGPFTYSPWSWQHQYASLPSGHTTTAFAAALRSRRCGRARAFRCWIFAVIIAASRVVITAHFVSDVVAAAFVGTFGAILVRNWFAARGLAFSPARTAPCTPGRGRPGAVSRRLPAGCLANKNAAQASARTPNGPKRSAPAAPCPHDFPAVSVVVPVRNEAENVGPLADEIAAALTGRWDFELIYVNDGSTDGTEAALIALKAERAWLRQIRHAASCGQSAAVRSGVMAARAPLVATLDGDGQNDPSFIPAMLTPSSRAAARSGWSPGSGSGAAPAHSRSCSRASPTACAPRSCATAPATPAAA